jgi:hypothetical protein
MRSEAEIKDYRHALLHALVVKCDCARTGHSFECCQGRMLVRNALEVIDWMMGQDDPIVQYMLNFARDQETKGGN